MDDFSHIEAIAPNGVASFGSDASLYVEFYRGSMIDGPASREAGTPIYKPVDMVRVIQPGERDVAEHLATPEYQRRWPMQWAAYQQDRKQMADGTPLDVLFPAQPETVATLKAAHIHTIQQLAGISDTAIGNLPMGRALVDTAKQYLAKASGGADFQKLKARNEELEADLRSLKARLEAVEAASAADAQKGKKAKEAADD